MVLFCYILHHNHYYNYLHRIFLLYSSNLEPNLVYNNLLIGEALHQGEVLPCSLLRRKPVRICNKISQGLFVRVKLNYLTRLTYIAFISCKWMAITELHPRPGQPRHNILKHHLPVFSHGLLAVRDINFNFNFLFHNYSYLFVLFSVFPFNDF